MTDLSPALVLIARACWSAEDAAALAHVDCARPPNDGLDRVSLSAIAELSPVLRVHGGDPQACRTWAWAVLERDRAMTIEFALAISFGDLERAESTAVLVRIVNEGRSSAWSLPAPKKEPKHKYPSLPKLEAWRHTLEQSHTNVA